MLWRGLVCDTASNKINVGKIKKVITEVTAKFKELNPEAMACKNGDLIQKPHWQLREEAETREAWNKMTPEE